MNKRQLVIIGAGPAGMAAAVAAYDSGCRDILLIERDTRTGGILNQCIHNGFGLHYFGEELTGPEYAARFADMVAERAIEVQLDTMVIDLSERKVITCVSRSKGLEQIEAQAVILAMGCRERPRGALGIPGTRCAGIFSAGTAQKLVNLEGLMPGRRVVILGSGDIGLIMARRMTFEGAKVLACVEIMPYSGGLKRNIVQCLDDFDIPLLLGHTVVDIRGRERLEAVTVAQVDKNRRPIAGTEQEFECDTLLLSVGLIPENELTRSAGIAIDSVTSGAVVDQNLCTVIEGVFACGNVLHVHDLVDHVSNESARAGKAAAQYIMNGGNAQKSVCVTGESGVRGVVPQRLSLPLSQEGLTLMFRPDKPYRKASVVVSCAGQELHRSRHPVLAPGEMVALTIKPEIAELITGDADVKVRIEQ